MRAGGPHQARLVDLWRHAPMLGAEQLALFAGRGLSWPEIRTTLKPPDHAWQRFAVVDAECRGHLAWIGKGVRRWVLTDAGTRSICRR